MKKIPFGKIYKVSKAFLVKHSADILTGFTACGVVITAIETHKSTLAAEEYLRINGYEQANPDTQKVLKFNAAKKYAVPVITGVATIGAAVGANYINHKQIAGLAAACTVAETALNEHRDKIEELMGEKALKKIDDEVNLDKGAELIANDEDIYDTGRGKVLCCEGYLTGRKFWADPDWIRKAVNDFNERVNQETYASYGEFLEILWQDCREIVIPKSAENLGYAVHSNGLMRIEITSDVDPKTGLPYLIFSPTNMPIANYMDMF